MSIPVLSRFSRGGIPLVNALPTGLTAADDGTLIRYRADDTAGVRWLLMYEHGSGTYPWRFLGGPPLYNETSAVINTNNVNTWENWGPTVTAPLAGDYDGQVDVWWQNSSGAQVVNWAAIGWGATPAGNNLLQSVTTMPASGLGNVHVRNRKTGLAAGSIVSIWLYDGSISAPVNSRQITITPVRVG